MGDGWEWLSVVLGFWGSRPSVAHRPFAGSIASHRIASHRYVIAIVIATATVPEFVCVAWFRRLALCGFQCQERSIFVLVAIVVAGAAARLGLHICKSRTHPKCSPRNGTHTTYYVLCAGAGPLCLEDREVGNCAPLVRWMAK